MTELIIDGVRAVLSSDFAVTVKQENPFITKNGEYTYDCTMSLLNPVNANLYSFLQRINKKDAFATNRRVILIADNRVYCDGTEVITKWTDTKVTIQIVSGNSQFNYFIGSDKKISELDLGSATVDATTINNALFGFEALGYAFPPFMIGENSYNIYKLELVNNDTLYMGKTINPDYEWRAIPFLNTMIVKIITALGYTIKSNLLESSEYKFILLYHSQDTVEFAKMFPGWTCKEFLEEVENLLNIVFYINYKTKEVEIVTQAKFYGTAGMVHVVNVKDAYEMDIETSDDSDSQEHTTSNIGYDLPDTDYYNLRRLPSAIIDMSTKKAMTASDFWNYVQNNTDFGMMLNIDPNNGRKYIAYLSSDNQKEIEQVDQFSDLIQDESKKDLDITLSIIPANLTHKLYSVPGSSTTVFDCDLPVLDEPSTNSETTTQNSLYDWINSGNYNKSEDSKSNIQAAIYYGPQYMLGTLFNKTEWAYPQAYTWIDVVDVYGKIFFLSDFTTKNMNASMNLQTIAKELYIEGYDINRKHKLTIESYDTNIYDPRLIFEIKNKRYVCESIEYTLDSKGRKGTWKGIFYPVDISDTDAEHLWILADGRWRDNGVWLDNGRWLDN